MAVKEGRDPFLGEGDVVRGELGKHGRLGDTFHFFRGECVSVVVKGTEVFCEGGCRQLMKLNGRQMLGQFQPSRERFWEFIRWNERLIQLNPKVGDEMRALPCSIGFMKLKKLLFYGFLPRLFWNLEMISQGGNHVCTTAFVEKYLVKFLKRP